MDDPVAVIAALAVPVIQGNIGTGGVVFLKDGLDQTEGIEDAALGERSRQGRGGIPRAQGIILHMGMGDGLVGLGGMRVFGHAVETPDVRPLVQAADVQLDVEGAKLDVPEGDGRGGGDDRVVIQVDAHLLKLIRKLFQVGQDA